MHRIEPSQEANALVPAAFETAEVRWFGEGELPTEVLEWFTANRTLGASWERTDSYQLNGSEDRGVKLRATSLLEVKTRLGFGPAVTSVNGLTGIIEQWSKVSNGDALAGTLQGFAFADVEKTAVCRSFRLGGSDVASIESPDRGHPGCEVELTSIRVEGVRAWSYAFEAYGDPAVRTQVLLSAVGAIERETPHPAALGDLLSDSQGYPAWINRLTAAGVLSPGHSRWPTAPDASGSFT